MSNKDYSKGIDEVNGVIYRVRQIGEIHKLKYNLEISVGEVLLFEENYGTEICKGELLIRNLGPWVPLRWASLIDNIRAIPTFICDEEIPCGTLDIEGGTLKTGRGTIMRSADIIATEVVIVAYVRKGKDNIPNFWLSPIYHGVREI